MPEVYRVVIHPFAKKHFLKDLTKKHKNKWSTTEDAIKDMLRRPDRTIKTSRLETVTQDGDIRIAKGYFKISGETASFRASGHRFIARLDDTMRTAELLLVYHKNHIKGQNETAWWRGLVRDLRQ